MQEHAIGLFDSGVGGLTVLRAMLDVLPKEKYIYLGDTARLPYGTKSQATIIKYALQCTEKLMQHKLKILVVACNTVSSVALPALRLAYPHVEIMGVVESGAKAACAATRNQYIGVIATESTIRGKAYDTAIRSINPHAKIIGKACPLFVAMAEDGLIKGELAEGLAKRYLSDLFANDSNDTPDCLVLGCTHFPLLKEAIQNVIGSQVQLVDSAVTIANAVQNFLIQNNLYSTRKKQELRFLTTDDVERFSSMGEFFLGLPLNKNIVTLINL